MSSLRTAGFSGYGGSNDVTPSLSRDRKSVRLTKYTHSLVVGLRLEGNLVYSYEFLGRTQETERFLS